MSPWSFIISLLESAPAAFDATARLLKAAKQSLRPAPPPPMGHDGAAEYLQGANNEKWAEAQRKRLKASAGELARKAAAQDDDAATEDPL